MQKNLQSPIAKNLKYHSSSAPALFDPSFDNFVQSINS